MENPLTDMAQQDDIWSRAIEQVIEASSSPERAKGLLNSGKIEHIDDDSIVVSFPNNLTKGGVDRSYLESIKDALFGLTNHDISVTTIVSNKPHTSTAPAQVVTSLFPTQTNNTTKEFTPITHEMKPVITTPTPPTDSYNRKFTFETFVVGESNEFAYGAALAVAESAGTSNKKHNPLFIHGRSGLGKTHLLCSIKYYVNENYPNLKTLYFQAKELVDDLAHISMSKDWPSFDKKYASNDVLLIDDIQFLMGKKESTDRVFQLLNDYKTADKQIVISSDRSPREIDMDERMISRFMGGLVVDVHPPSFETKLGILKNYKTHFMPELNLNDDVLPYIAEISSSNIREIEGALSRIDSYAALRGEKIITVDNAKEILRDFFPEKNARRITIDLIQRETEKFFSITHEEMIGSKRDRRINIPRQIAMYLSRSLTDESFPSIGKKFGNRDHSTIMNGVGNIEKDLKESRELNDQIERLSRIIKDKA